MTDIPPAIFRSKDVDQAPSNSKSSALAVVGRMAPGLAISEDLRALLIGPLGDAISTAADFADHSLAVSTERTYTREWRNFVDWCHTQKIDTAVLPLHPVLVAAYLAGLVPKVGKSGLKVRLAAIAHHHHRQGHVWTANHPAITATLRGIVIKHGKPIRPAAALTSTEIRQLLSSCGNNLAGLRDRALLLVGFAGALRRSELVAIDHEHLRFNEGGLSITIPRSKRDQEGQGAIVTLPRMRGDDTCPVKAMERWLQRAGINYGPVFRAITAWGTLENRLAADGTRWILLRRAKLAELKVDPTERLSPHGLRAGFITEAYLAAAPDEQVMAHTRHGDVSTMRGYRRRAKITTDNPARLLDL
jgi:integrase